MSVNRFTRAALAAAVTCAIAAPAAASELEEIIVTAPVHRGEAETVLPVNVIGEDALRRKLGATIGQTLRQEVGVTYASFGPGVGQPVIRGQGAPRVLVLANSMPIGDASNTSNDHANATEPVLAERIEVLRGPATLLFGSGAIGGVVNVIDNRVPGVVPDAPTGAIEYRRASNADASVLAGRVEGGTGRLALHLDGFTRENDAIEIPGAADIDGEGGRGQIDNTDADARSGTAGASWVGDRGFLGVSVNRLENEYGIPGGAHAHHHEDEEGGEEADGHDAAAEAVRIDMEQTRYDLRGEFEEPLPGVERLRSYFAWTDYQHDELEGGAVGTTYGNNAFDGRIEAVHEIGPLHGALGLQLGSRDFKAVGEEAFVPSSESDSWGLFLIEDWHLDTVVWEFGLRTGHDEHNVRGGSARDFDTLSASVSALWQPVDAHDIKVSLSRAERAPSAEELFSDGFHVATGSYEIGDPGLDVEASVNLDLGYHFHGERFDLRVDAFANRYADYIYQQVTGSVFNPELEAIEAVCTADDPDECAEVLRWAADDARFTGVEVELEMPLPGGFSLTLFGDGVRGELDDGGNVPRLPPVRAGAGLGWADGPWDVAARLTEAMDQDRPGSGQEPTRGYTALDAHVEYRLQRGATEWVLFLRGDNLLDEEIRNATSLLRGIAPEAGRSVEAGVRLGF